MPSKKNTNKAKDTRSASRKPASKPAGKSTRPEGKRSAPGKAGKGAGKVGSSPQAARKRGGKLDFGIPEPSAARYSRQEGRVYGKEAGAPQGHAGTAGRRDTGVAGVEGQPGASSGGDVDTSITGVGSEGRGLAQSAPDRITIGPSQSTGGSEEFASGPPAEGKNAVPRGRVGGKKKIEGTAVNAEAAAANAGAAQHESESDRVEKKRERNPRPLGEGTRVEETP